MIVRAFRYEDLSAVSGLAYSYLDEHYSPDFFLTIWEASPRGFIVAEEKEEIVGFILGVMTDTYSLRILMVCMQKSMRGQGIGSALVDSFIANFPRAKTVSLEVKVNNMRAINFYERNGFYITSFLPHFYNDGTDGYLMEKRLL